MYEVSIAQFAADTGYAPAAGCWAFIGSEWIFDEQRSWRKTALDQGDDHPVTCVNWHDAVAYTDWLSRRTGQRYRLLSEAKWEYTARAGTQTPYWFGANADSICECVNLGDVATRDEFRWHEKDIKFEPLDNWTYVPCNDGHATTAPVTFGSSNPFGIYNMLGNVTELVADCWPRTGASTSASGSPETFS